MRTVTVLKTKVETKKTCMMLRPPYGLGNWLSGANDSTVNSFELERILPCYGRYCFKFLNFFLREFCLVMADIALNFSTFLHGLTHLKRQVI